VVAKKVLKVLRRELASEELDQEFRELNSGQVKANARLAVGVPRGVNKKKRSAAVGRRMMRAEEETGENNRLLPVSVLLNRGDIVVENAKVVKGKEGKKVINIPTLLIEKMELESGGEEVDFEGEQRDEVRVEIPQDILKVVARSVLANQEEPVEMLSSTFLNNLVSDRMDVDLGEEYEREIHEIVQDLEASGREAGLDGSPARAVKEELIERVEVSSESRKKRDGKTSSDSAEEVEHIMIEDSVERETYMIRTMMQGGKDEPNPQRDVLTPVIESTPIEGRDKERGKIGFRPLTAPKKKSGCSRSQKKESGKKGEKVAMRNLPPEGDHL